MWQILARSKTEANWRFSLAHGTEQKFVNKKLNRKPINVNPI